MGKSTLDQEEVDLEELIKQAEDDQMEDSTKRDYGALEGAKEADEESTKAKRTGGKVQQKTASDILFEVIAKQQDSAKASEKPYTSGPAEATAGCTGRPASSSGDAPDATDGTGEAAFEGTAQRAAWEDPERCG